MQYKINKAEDGIMEQCWKSLTITLGYKELWLVLIAVRFVYEVRTHNYCIMIYMGWWKATLTNFNTWCTLWLAMFEYYDKYVTRNLSKIWNIEQKKKLHLKPLYSHFDFCHLKKKFHWHYSDYNLFCPHSSPCSSTSLAHLCVSDAPILATLFSWH